MHTTEEARKTWCPYVRYSAEGFSWRRAINRWIGATDKQFNPDPARCIADECSQWCWGEEAHWEGDTSGMRPEDTGAVTVRRGFCGRNVAMAMKVFGP